jgi:hypothetical protein
VYALALDRILVAAFFLDPDNIIASSKVAELSILDCAHLTQHVDVNPIILLQYLHFFFFLINRAFALHSFEQYM